MQCLKQLNNVLQSETINKFHSHQMRVPSPAEYVVWFLQTLLFRRWSFTTAQASPTRCSLLPILKWCGMRMSVMCNEINSGVQEVPVNLNTILECTTQMPISNYHLSQTPPGLN